jgi:hypothetical protein
MYGNGIAGISAFDSSFGSGEIRFQIAFAEVARITSAGNFQFNSGYGSVATAYGCRAWVNFNGTGTVAIRASGNVSSITDNGVGDYTVNFTTAMPDANYAVMSLSNGIPLDDGATARTASAFRFNTYNFAGVKFDTSVVNVAVFR